MKSNFVSAGENMIFLVIVSVFSQFSFCLTSKIVVFIILEATW